MPQPTGWDSLARSTQPALVFGGRMDLGELLRQLQGRLGWGVVVDLRTSRADLASRRELADALGKGRAFVLLSPEPSAEICALLAEALGGRLHVAPGDTRALGPQARLLAVCPVDAPPPALARRFPLQLPASRL